MKEGVKEGKRTDARKKERMYRTELTTLIQKANKPTNKTKRNNILL